MEQSVNILHVGNRDWLLPIRGPDKHTRTCGLISFNEESAVKRKLTSTKVGFP